MEEESDDHEFTHWVSFTVLPKGVDYLEVVKDFMRRLEEGVEMRTVKIHEAKRHTEFVQKDGYMEQHVFTRGPTMSVVKARLAADFFAINLAQSVPCGETYKKTEPAADTRIIYTNSPLSLDDMQRLLRQVEMDMETGEWGVVRSVKCGKDGLGW